MSSSVACKSQHAADVYVSDPVAQSSELSLVEMTEVEYLQHIIQSHIDAQVTETDGSGLSQLEESLYDESERRMSGSPHTPLASAGASTGPVDLQDIKMLLLSESESSTTPASGAPEPGPVQTRVQCVAEERSDGRHRPSPAARVCLEKRFLSVLCHPTNTSGIATHAQTEKWSKPEKMMKIQGTHPHEGRVLTSGGQQSELVFPTEMTVGFRADTDSASVKRAPLVLYPHTADTLKNEAGDKANPVKRVHTRRRRPSDVPQDSENWRPHAGVSGTKRCRTRPLTDPSLRKEVHNRKERDRRRRIRLCCDELNLLVPFCYADTDKATTLQWTTAFLKHIQEIHGDRLKQDFQSTFCGKTGLRLKPSGVPGPHLLEPCKNGSDADSSSHR